MVFKCEKVEKIYFFVEADNEEQAQEFIQTHGINEIVEMIPDKCIDSEDAEQVLFPVDGYADIDIRTTYGISVETLYKEYGENLTYCKIEKTEDENGVYFDLYNNHGLLAICDGENAVIVTRDKDKIRLYAEDEEDSNREFDLTPEEFGIATFN